MTENVVFVAIIVLAMVAVVLVVRLPDPRRARLAVLADALVRFSAVASVAVLTTALMYMIEAITGSRIPLAVGDGAMVIAAWMMWTALNAVNGRTRLPALLTGAVATVCATVSLCVPEEASTPVKLIAVAVGCLLIGVESLRGRVRASSVYGVFAGVGFGFGAYTVARVSIAGVLGTDSLVYGRAFDTLASAVVAGVAIVATGTAVVALYTQLTPRPSQNTEPAMAVSIALRVLSHGRDVTVYCMDVPDVALIRITHGVAAADALRDALVEAASSCFPAGIFAVSPAGDHLAIVEPERQGAASLAPELTRAFDSAVQRAELVDLTEVDVIRHVVTEPEELRSLLEPLRATTRAARVSS